MTDLAMHMPIVARALLGEPNERLSKLGRELRFGNNGSVSVDIEKGTFFDHEASAGGGVLDLIKSRKGLHGADAFAFLREIGCEVEDERPRPNGAHRNGHHAGEEKAERVFDETYSYVDENGALLYQAIRCVFKKPDGSFLRTDGGKRKKTFLQRRPDADKAGSWIWSVKGVRQVPYRLPQLLEAIAEDQTVFVVEGERKAEALARIGLAATCNVGGSGKWTAELSRYLAGARVMILPDNDEAGRKHAQEVGTLLADAAASVMLLELPDLPPKGDVVDWLSEGGTAADLQELAAKAVAFGQTVAEPFRSKFGAIRWHEQDAAKHEQEWAIKKLIPLRSKVMIVGAKQSGKSFFTEGAALCLSRGVDFFGYRVPKPFGVIYGAVEAGAGFRNRLKAYRQFHGLTLAPLPFAVLTQEFNLFNAAEDVENLIQECLGLAAEFPVPLGAVVIDTYNAATPGIDENSAGEVAKVISKINTLMRRTGAGVWLVHHKNALGGIRGSTGLPAAFETVIEISRIVEGQFGPLRDSEKREIRNARVMFQREGVEGDTFNFVLPAVEIGRDADGDAITSCVVAPPAQAPGEQAAGPRGFVLKASNGRTSYEALIGALGERGGKAPAGHARSAPRRALVVHRDYWRDALMRSAIGSKHDDPHQRAEHVKKVLQRAMEKLGQWGLIGIDYPWVWRTSKLVAGYDPPPHAFEEATEAQEFAGDDELFGTEAGQ